MVRSDALGTLALVIGLAAATVAWAAFGLTRTILDSSLTDRVVDEVYNDAQVREVLETNIGNSFDATLPEGVEIEQSQLDAAAEGALDDPAVEEAIRTSLAAAHAALLGDGAAPEVVDSAELGTAMRAAAVEANPELDALLPEASSLEIELPTGSIPDLGGVRDLMGPAEALGVVLAVVGVAAAFVVSWDRPRVLSRVGIWGLMAGGLWVVVGLGIPVVAETVLPGTSAIAGVMVTAFVGSMLAPAWVAIALGAMAVIGGWAWGRHLWSVHEAAEVAAAEQPSEVPAPVAAPQAGAPVGGAPTAAEPALGAGPAPVSAPNPAVGPATSPPGARLDPAPKWVDGVGYVEDGDEYPEPQP